MAHGGGFCFGVWSCDFTKDDRFQGGGRGNVCVVGALCWGGAKDGSFVGKEVTPQLEQLGQVMRMDVFSPMGFFGCLTIHMIG